MKISKIKKRIVKKGVYHLVVVKNIGKNSTGKKFKLSVYIGKKWIKTVTVKTIKAGKSRTVKVWIPRKYKNRVKTFKMDSTNRIIESNGKNNKCKAR